MPPAHVAIPWSRDHAWDHSPTGSAAERTRFFRLDDNIRPMARLFFALQPSSATRAALYRARAEWSGDSADARSARGSAPDAVLPRRSARRTASCAAPRGRGRARRGRRVDVGRRRTLAKAGILCAVPTKLRQACPFPAGPLDTRRSHGGGFNPDDQPSAPMSRCCGDPGSGRCGDRPPMPLTHAAASRRALRADAQRSGPNEGDTRGPRLGAATACTLIPRSDAPAPSCRECRYFSRTGTLIVATGPALMRCASRITRSSDARHVGSRRPAHSPRLLAPWRSSREHRLLRAGGIAAEPGIGLAVRMSIVRKVLKKKPMTGPAFAASLGFRRIGRLHESVPDGRRCSGHHVRNSAVRRDSVRHRLAVPVVHVEAPARDFRSEGTRRRELAVLVREEPEHVVQRHRRSR